jgi:hypothetical protein
VGYAGGSRARREGITAAGVRVRDLRGEGIAAAGGHARDPAGGGQSRRGGGRDP